MNSYEREPAGDQGMLVISVDSESFSGEFLSSALPFLASRHETFRVVVADDLMTYNRFSIDENPDYLNRIFSQYWNDRRTGVNKVLARFRLEDCVSISRYNDYCDPEFSRLYRRFWRIALSDPLLKKAVEEKAMEFIRHDRKRVRSRDRSEEIDVVYQFLVEETAWAIHMASNLGVTDQYYPLDSGSLIRFCYSYKNSERLMKLLHARDHVHAFWNIDVIGDGVIFDASSWCVRVSDYTCMKKELHKIGPLLGR